MKRITFLFMLFLFVSFSAFSQVQVGTGTNTNQKVPFKTDSFYSYGQSIYLASEINASGMITSIQWYFAGNGNLSNNQQLVIYMGNTTKSVFASETDWVPLANLTQVYSGGITTNSTPGWKTITLTTPFSYNGTNNLVIAVAENQELENSFDDKFYNTAVTGTRSISIWGDQAPIDPATPDFAYDLASFVPNIIFGGISQACPTPLYVTTSTTTTTATVSWQAPTTPPANGSDYYISTSAVEPTVATVPTGSITSGASFNALSLTPGTTYYVWIRNNCGAGLYSNWSTVSTFTTDCVGVAAFFENFDSVTEPDLPSCWTKILRGAGLSSDASVETMSISSVSSPNLAYLNCSNSSATSEIMLVSPNVSNFSAGSNRLKFYARGNMPLKVGALSSNNSDAVFYEVGAITPTNVMTEYIIDFTTYTGSYSNIGFILDNSLPLPNNNGNVRIDNVKWELAPTCPDVTLINVPEVTTNGATINWTAGSGSNTLSWDVAVGLPTITDPNMATIVNSTTTTKVISGLVDNTNYKVWVRSVCTGNDNGAWIGPVTFKTACLPLATGFYENFNQTTTPDLPSCWSKIISGPTVSQYAWVETNEFTDLFPSPNTAVQMFNDGSGPTDNIILVSPNLSTLSLSTYRLKFYAKYANNPASVQIVTLNSNTSAATINVIQNVVLTENTAQYVVNFNGYSGTDTYIGFRMNTTDSYTQVLLDNILWEIIPNCPDVTQINVPSTTPNSATINWTAGGSEVSWDVAYALPAVEEPSGLTFVNTATASTILTGLSANTTYNVWVRSVCAGNDKGAWIGPVSFTTACDAVAAFIETFENAATPQLPACWNKIITGDTEYPGSIETQIAYMPNETTAVLLKNKESEQVILVSPNLNTLVLGTYRLKFVAKGGDPIGILEVGTLSSGTETAVFNSLSTVNTNSTPTEYIVDFDGYTGDDTYIGIRVSNTIQYQYIELDNIVWEPMPLCPDVNEISVAETTTTTGTIVWDGGTATNWQVAVGSTTDTNPDILTPIAVDSPSYEITNLTAGTSYNVWVRSVCGAPFGNGYWEGPFVLTTQCIATTVPYVQDFESAIIPNLPACTSAYNLSEGPYNWYTSYEGFNYGFENAALTYNGDCCTDANAWFYTQGITLTAGVNYTISYRYGATTDTEDLYLNSLKVMYGTQATETSMTLPIADHEDFLTATPILESVTITPPATGVYYFGFDAYSDNNSYLMFVDDIVIDVALATNQFDTSNFSYYPNPVKDILNISYIDAITAVSVYNLLGQEVITKSVNDNLTKIDMSSLSKGTYLVKVASDNLVKTIKVIKQ